MMDRAKGHLFYLAFKVYDGGTRAPLLQALACSSRPILARLSRQAASAGANRPVHAYCGDGLVVLMILLLELMHFLITKVYGIAIKPSLLDLAV
jgi:hypothetical protein